MILRLDPSKLDDLRRLIATGLIWNPTVPRAYKLMAVDALVDGRAEPNALIPADARAHIDELRNGMERPPLG